MEYRQQLFIKQPHMQSHGIGLIRSWSLDMLQGRPQSSIRQHLPAALLSVTAGEERPGEAEEMVDTEHPIL